MSKKSNLYLSPSTSKKNKFVSLLRQSDYI
jgi:hypothetical protein